MDGLIAELQMLVNLARYVFAGFRPTLDRLCFLAVRLYS